VRSGPVGGADRIIRHTPMPRGRNPDSPDATAVKPGGDQREERRTTVSIVSEMLSFASFARAVPSLLRSDITLESARSIVRRRLEDRPSNFLRSVERGVWSNPRSPYRALFRAARCERADLDRLVADRGVEGALYDLRDAGVFITFEEFKCQRPIERGDVTIEVTPADFDNPSFRRYYPVTTGGSTGLPRRVLMDIDFLEARIPIQRVMMDAHGLADVPMVQWVEIPPGHGLEAALVQAAQGFVLDRWFTPVWAGANGPGWRFRAATHAAVAIARRSGVPVPMPEYLPFDRADVIARWAESALRSHGRCAIRAHVSKALRIAIAATENGIDLTGVTITSGGEPPTPAKVRRITDTGARFIPNYFFMEAGPIGLGCTDASGLNDQHFMSDHLAVVTNRRAVAGFGVEVDAFQYTTLLPTAPKLLINVETDDYGRIERRTCGCPFGEIGFDTHLHDIRSFSKLTGEGVTLVGSEMERILEESLPATFGGSPLDWQLVEEEDERGFTRLSLLIDPRVEIDDERRVLDFVHDALRRAGGGADVSRAIWSQANTLRLIREQPRLNARGKLWPLHAERRLTDAMDGHVRPSLDAGAPASHADDNLVERTPR
jgi:hypothetical protein